MNIPGWLVWAIGQGLGRKGPRMGPDGMLPAQPGYTLLALLRGPLGLLLDLASKGQISAALGEADKVAAEVARVARGTAP